MVVTHRCGTDSLEIHAGGRIAAAHLLAPPGAHRTIRQPDHAEALQAAVLSAFDTAETCRPKANRPPQPPSRSHSSPPKPRHRRRSHHRLGHLPAPHPTRGLMSPKDSLYQQLRSHLAYLKLTAAGYPPESWRHRL